MTETPVVQAYERLMTAIQSGIYSEDAHGVEITPESINNVIENLLGLSVDEVMAVINSQVVSGVTHRISQFDVPLDQTMGNSPFLDAALTAAFNVGLVCFMTGWMSRDVQQDDRAVITFHG